MVSKNCPITGEHVGIIFVTQQSHFKFSKISGGSEPHIQIFFQTLPKVASSPAYQNSITRKKIHRAVFEKRLKLKLRVF